MKKERNEWSRNHRVTVKNFPGGTSEKVLEEIENLVAGKPDCIIIHAGMNDIVNGINSNSVKKTVKNEKKVLQTRNFSSPVYYSEKIKTTFRKVRQI